MRSVLFGDENDRRPVCNTVISQWLNCIKKEVGERSLSLTFPFLPCIPSLSFTPLSSPAAKRPPENQLGESGEGPGRSPCRKHIIMYLSSKVAPDGSILGFVLA